MTVAIAPDPARMEGETLGALCDRIVATHHAFCRDAFARLEPLAETVARVHAGERAPGEALAVLRALSDDLLTHLTREERILFPWVAFLDGASPPAPPFGRLSHPLRVMASDHGRAHGLLAALREATDGYRVPAQACGSWRALWEGLAALDADLVAHMRLEDEVLFPRALAREALVHPPSAVP